MIDSSGRALIFCVPCLEKNGYPVEVESPRGKLMRATGQAVTIKDGNALCAFHFEQTIQPYSPTPIKE